MKTPVKVEKANTGTTRSRLRLWPIVRTDYLHIHAENNEEGAEIHFGALIFNLAPSPFFSVLFVRPVCQSWKTLMYYPIFNNSVTHY